MEQIQRGAVGIPIRLWCKRGAAKRDISGADPQYIRLRAPGDEDGFDVISVFINSGTDGGHEYVTQSEQDLDTVGIWQAQSVLHLPTGLQKSSINYFEVLDNL